ncbi:LPS assembly lipoprotein LptE [Rhodovulum sp. YNF3179]|mgnify:CR=1 FL=1|uniref:LPS assembly lipoprotein LptE n=1 Tax=Rhodovulum sp. YNF3179 TaxID=3425127 RepID=UPI003D3322F5
MSSSDRRTFVLGLAALPLAGCGFRPVYGPAGPAAGLMGQIAVDPAGTERGFALVGRLQERLGRAGAAAPYALAVSVETESEGIAITTTNEIGRFNLAGVARFALRDAARDVVLTEGTVENFTSYSATGSTVGTLAAERDAYDRLMRALADQIVTRLLASAPDWRT